MIVYPNAKINLGLNIVGRRAADGYHLLETLFYPVPLADVLEVCPQEGGTADRLTVYGNDTLADEADNLVLRAARALRTLFPIPPLDVYLSKQIPSGAGMGGGSADASFMLKALRDELALPLDDDKLRELALTLGADCPFFIGNKPAIGRGIGEELTPHPLDLSGFTLVLAKPQLHISTAEAFRGLGQIGRWELPLQEVLRLDMADWPRYLHNDFERSLFPRYAELPRLKALLYELGAVYASMTGSGSVIYGLFAPNHLPDLSPIEALPDTQLWQIGL
ncbi:MAG: 4-(cytidine 5'-diphospho)-2-C-methyl-D-erythritol kinase [Porphyromonadaceae bacterium]|nr:4-(cytidine 5'-diphospho)-2-C-methyl-D-erythritol kinase [Porphyromonadaceae bacterium]